MWWNAQADAIHFGGGILKQLDRALYFVEGPRNTWQFCIGRAKKEESLKPEISTGVTTERSWLWLALQALRLSERTTTNLIGVSESLRVGAGMAAERSCAYWITSAPESNRD